MAQSFFGGRLFGAGNAAGTHNSERIEPTFGDAPVPAMAPAAQSVRDRAIDAEPTFARKTIESREAPAFQSFDNVDAAIAPAKPYEYKLATETPNVTSEPNAVESDSAADINAANEKFLALAAKYRVDRQAETSEPAQDISAAPAPVFPEPSSPTNSSQDAYDGIRQLEPISAAEAEAVKSHVVAPKHSEIPDALGFSTNAEPKPLYLGTHLTVSSSSSSIGQPLSSADPAPKQAAASYDQLAAAPMATSRRPGVDLGAQSFRPQTAAPSGLNPGVRVESLRVDHDVARAAKRSGGKRRAVIFASVLALFGLGGMAAYAALFGDFGSQAVVRIQHDLSEEKIIPEVGQRGGYEVPHQDFQVLQRNSDLVSQFTSSRAAPDPERPSLTSLVVGDEQADQQQAGSVLLQPGASLVPSPVLLLNDPNTPSIPGMRPIAPTRQSTAINALAAPQITLNDPSATAILEDMISSVASGDATFQPVQLILDGGVSGPRSDGASVFVPTPENPDFTEDGVPDTPIPNLVPATQVTSPWGLQIAALRTSDSARRLWQNMQQANFNLLVDVGFKIETIQSNSGTLFRLQIGPFPTRATAMDVCAELQKNEGNIGCFAVTSGS